MGVSDSPSRDFTWIHVVLDLDVVCSTDMGVQPSHGETIYRTCVRGGGTNISFISEK